MFDVRRSAFDVPTFLPTATLQTLRMRADMLDWLRAFFRRHGYWEVQTPLLSRDVCVDAWLEPFAVPLLQGVSSRRQFAYLQTSPEFAMKRLIAAGAEAIFQVTPAFRQEESGHRHNPEFTMVEWYRVGDTYHDQMAFTQSLTTKFLDQACRHSTNSHPLSIEGPIPRLTYEAAFEQACGRGVLSATMDDIRDLAARHSVIAPGSLRDDDRDGWLNLLLADVVEPPLAKQPALFLHDYPASQAALARVRPDDPPVAERFELYLSGIEICNGYQELTDADELRRRIAVQSQLRTEAGLPPLPTDSRLLDAMDAGLPDCAGVALGFDRLMMIAIGSDSVRDVIPFPFDRA